MVHGPGSSTLISIVPLETEFVQNQVFCSFGHGYYFEFTPPKGYLYNQNKL